MKVVFTIESSQLKGYEKDLKPHIKYKQGDYYYELDVDCIPNKGDMVFCDFLEICTVISVYYDYRKESSKRVHEVNLTHY